MLKASNFNLKNQEDKKTYRCPSVATDVIIQCTKSNGEVGYIIIERKNPPHGFAIPGGFVDYGEAVYDAAIREAKEEVCLDVCLVEQMFAYSHPSRDPRQHVVSITYFAMANGDPVAADDAKGIVWVPEGELEEWIEENKDKLVCDHYNVLKDFVEFWMGDGGRPQPCDESERL